MPPFKRLLNYREEQTHRILSESTPNNSARLFAKVRVADVLPIENSGISDALFSYALRAHFDFVISDRESMPLFAVEYDGPQHSTNQAVAKLDLLKNQLCDKFELPIARVTDEHILKKARGMDYLTWLTELFFVSRWLEEAQTKGHLPPDEYFDPMIVARLPNRKARFPLFISADARARLHRLEEDGRIRCGTPEYIAGRDSSGYSGCCALLMVDDHRYIRAETRIYVRYFGLDPSEITDEIASLALAQTVDAYLAGDSEPIQPHTLRSELIRFVRRYPRTTAQGGTSAITFPFMFSYSYRAGEECWRFDPFEAEPEVLIEVPPR
jgi:hypothetical protein